MIDIDIDIAVFKAAVFVHASYRYLSPVSSGVL